LVRAGPLPQPGAASSASTLSASRLRQRLRQTWRSGNIRQDHVKTMAGLSRLA
jgi:hypothetical protein